MWRKERNARQIQQQSMMSVMVVTADHGRSSPYPFWLLLTSALHREIDMSSSYPSTALLMLMELLFDERHSLTWGKREVHGSFPLRASTKSMTPYLYREFKLAYKTT